MVPGDPTRNVSPSGRARAATSVPMLPEAPVRFSTMNCTFMFWDKRAAMSLATTSTAEPAVKGLMSRTGREGHSCASENPLKESVTAPSATAARRRQINDALLIRTSCVNCLVIAPRRLATGHLRARG